MGSFFESPVHGFHIQMSLGVGQLQYIQLPVEQIRPLIEPIINVSGEEQTRPDWGGFSGFLSLSWKRTWGSDSDRARSSCAEMNFGEVVMESQLLHTHLQTAMCFACSRRRTRDPLEGEKTLQQLP
ncbi:H+-or Na+-translocating f-type [Striga asiatica]|uniref:H+-or Na+-translocating f-type n=1 Tax=Striga asiatica TaxID=4170 RepID=A0A5A7RHZ4_STRAF|nr:H+-or Na+-translocating f-type [Striga asiatica]